MILKRLLETLLRWELKQVPVFGSSKVDLWMMAFFAITITLTMISASESMQVKVMAPALGWLIFWQRYVLLKLKAAQKQMALAADAKGEEAA